MVTLCLGTRTIFCRSFIRYPWTRTMVESLLPWAIVRICCLHVAISA